MTYAQAVHEGAQAVFYFMLPHYVEGETQFGVLRPDLTPRPAFVALAAVGRLLADAKPLGRLKTGSGSIHAFLFQARPDGRRADVLVAWSEAETAFELPKPPKACFDHLGRAREVSGKVLKLSRAPLLFVLADGTCLPLVPPPNPPKLMLGKPSPVVMQAVLPEETIVLGKSAYKIPAGQTTSIPIFLYNFGGKPARGRLSTSMSFRSAKPIAPDVWGVEFPTEVEVAPGERKELALRLTSVSTNGLKDATIRITGEFGGPRKPVLSLNLVPGVK
jgi:hypothetical protein